MKREWQTHAGCSDPTRPYRPVQTRYGAVMVAVWPENRINVEMREPLTVNGAAQRGTFTLKCPVWGTFELVGRFASGATSTSAQRKILDAVGKALSEQDWIEAEFLLADRREVNNDIIRADEDIVKAEKALGELRAKRDELLRKETALGGPLTSEADEPAA